MRIFLIIMIGFMLILVGCKDEVSCASDVFECPDGSYVSRDPDNDCKFMPCPTAKEANISKGLGENQVILDEYDPSLRKAERFIKTSKTYLTDGYDLEYVGTVRQGCDSCYRIKYRFLSNFEGYGDKDIDENANEFENKSEISHEVAVDVIYGKVMKAVIDGKWNMITQQMNSPEQIECEGKGGEWSQNGMFCYVPSSDAGKACNDSSECIGLCLATLTEEQQESLDEKELEITGNCSDYEKIKGCVFPVIDNKVKEQKCY